MQGSHASSLAPPDLEQNRVPSPRSPAAGGRGICESTGHSTATVAESCAGWVRLVKLATHAIQTVDTSCGGAGVACQQLGAA